MKTASTQSIASSRGIAVCWLPRRTARATERCALHLVVDVLDLDGGFIDQDADGQRQAAQGHQVDRLPGEPHRHQRAAECEGDVEDDDDDAPPVAEEEQHHQPGQDGAQGALGDQAPNGVGDRGRLVELETDLDVVGQDRLHAGQGLLDVVDDRERGGVGPLGHEDVDGASAVDQGIARGDVAGVLHGRDVADVDGRVLPGADRDRLQLLDLSDQGVDRHDRHHLADADVPEGLIVLPASSAPITSSGDIR